MRCGLPAISVHSIIGSVTTRLEDRANSWEGITLRVTSKTHTEYADSIATEKLGSKGRREVVTHSYVSTGTSA